MGDPFQPDLPGQKSEPENARKGKEFEAEIIAANNFYRKNGYVDIRRNAERWEPVDRLRPGQTADAYLREKAGVKSKSQTLTVGGSGQGERQHFLDTISITANGIVYRRLNSDVDFSGGNDEGAYAFDTKETRGDHIPLPNLKPHQIEQLKWSAKCRVCAGFLIKFTEEERVYFAPIKFVLEKQKILLDQDRTKRAKPGTASISIAELEQHGVEVLWEKNPGYWDWFRYVSVVKRSLL